MRKFDKKHNINKVNILSEQRYLTTKGLIKENLDEEYYESRKPVKDYIDAEDLINKRLWFHTNRTHRNNGWNGMIGIYGSDSEGKKEGSPLGYTNEVRIKSPIYFQTSESGSNYIKNSVEKGAIQRVLIAGFSGVVVPTRSGDINGMVMIKFDPLDEAPWFYVVGDNEKKQIVSADEVYFNATEAGNWETYAANPIFAEQKSIEEPDLQ
jgi:hypothetical protein